MNNKIGKVQFDENEVDCLIRSFGMSQSNNARREINDMLRRQKEPFIAREIGRKREGNSRHL